MTHVWGASTIGDTGLTTFPTIVANVGASWTGRELSPRPRTSRLLGGGGSRPLRSRTLPFPCRRETWPPTRPRSSGDAAVWRCRLAYARLHPRGGARRTREV